MLDDLSGTHPKEMKLALLKPFARRGDAGNVPVWVPVMVAPTTTRSSSATTS